MKEVYTYADPFKISENKDIWEIVKTYPHFCASDTLVQGMTECYGRNTFTIIQTVNALQKSVIGNVTNNSVADMQLFLDVMHSVRESKMNQMCKDAFLNNAGEVVAAIKYMLVLEVEESRFNKALLCEEQQELLNIYSAVKEKYSSEIEKLFEFEIDDLKTAIKKTLLSEVEYQLKRNHSIAGITDWKCKDVQDAHKKLQRVIAAYEKKVECREDLDFSNTAIDRIILNQLEIINSRLENIEDIDCSTIVVHGVHRFTPEMLLLFKVLEHKGINVCFLIHYVDNLPEIYNTWKNVYGWTGCEFKCVQGIKLDQGKEVGFEIAKVLHGKKSTKNLRSKKYIYPNLSAFASSEVRKTFIDAGEELAKMKVQYYAVSNTETNEILRNYFPEQFEIKPFLSYPIGQFILGLYNMWDFDEDLLVLDENALKNCAVSGLGWTLSDKSIIETLDKAWLYIKDVKVIKDVYGRLDTLKQNLSFIDRNEILKDLNCISFFSLTEREIDALYEYIQYIELLSQRIFLYKKEQVNYREHFRELMEVISSPVNGAENISLVEKQLVAEVFEALQRETNTSVIGDFKDVQEALKFFLRQREVDDSSNWIVRNFEQIDGAVLLSNSTKASEYHFALMSMKNMSRQVNQALPWPLTEKMFFSYEDEDIHGAVYATITAVMERSNFLKFSFFYGTFFSKKRVSVSFIENQNGENQRPYYLLNLLSFTNGNKLDELDLILEQETPEICAEDYDVSKIGIREKEMFAICAHKFYIYSVLNESIEYSSEFHIKYFLSNFLLKLLAEDKKTTLENIEKRTERYIDEFKRKELFPMFDVIVFEDIKNKVIEDFKKGYEYRNYDNSKYNRRKRDFLIAKWEDKRINQNVMDFTAYSDQAINDFMKSPQLFLIENPLPHEKVCENCCYNDRCLMNYYKALTLKER